MVTGDWPRSTLLPTRWSVPLPWLGWPWLYLTLLAVSFVVLACVFFWQGYTLSNRGAEAWKVYGAYGLGVAFASLGLAGLRERHRR